MAEELWEGITGSECGEHRTVGYRAWCFRCQEWCYPRALCRGCEVTVAEQREEPEQEQAMNEPEWSLGYPPQSAAPMFKLNGRWVDERDVLAHLNSQQAEIRTLRAALEDAAFMLELIAEHDPDQTFGSVKVYMGERKGWLQDEAREWLERCRAALQQGGEG